jgi:carboxymethylenebutenolidase
MAQEVAVPSFDVSVPTPDGTCPARLLTPEGEGPWPAVIVLPDAGGPRASFYDMGQRVADLGYVALVPQIYYRTGPYEPFKMETAFSDEGERARLMKLGRSVTMGMAASDAGAFLDFLSAQPQVAGSRAAIVGYCRSGGMALTAAARHPERIAAAASFHGGYLATDAPDSPHTVAGDIGGRVYVAAAENDGSCPPEQLALLDEALTGGDVDHTIETYPAAHGFAVVDNPTYDPDADARHWAALAELWASTLGDPTG